MQHTLTRHRDIQAWIADRRGLPAVARVADQFGEVRPRLTIQFGHAESVSKTPGMDDGVSPVSWTAWLAEFDRQELALQVAADSAFELVARKDLH